MEWRNKWWVDREGEEVYQEIKEVWREREYLVERERETQDTSSVATSDVMSKNKEWKGEDFLVFVTQKFPQTLFIHYSP
jgi:hypothetical protein